MAFPNSSINSKFGFWNVALGLFILSNFSQFTKELENSDLKSPCFHILSNDGIVLQNDMWRRGGGVNV